LTQVSIVVWFSETGCSSKSIRPLCKPSASWHHFCDYVDSPKQSRIGRRHGIGHQSGLFLREKRRFPFRFDHLCQFGFFLPQLPENPLTSQKLFFSWWFWRQKRKDGFGVSFFSTWRLRWKASIDRNLFDGKAEKFFG